MTITSPTHARTTAAALAHAVQRNVRRLIFRVHPDYFHRVPEQKRANEGALQQLQSLVAPIVHQTESEVLAPSIEITLHARSLSTSTTSTLIHQSFDTKHHWQRAAGLLALCEQAGVAPAVEDVRLVERARQETLTAGQQRGSDTATLVQRSVSSQKRAFEEFRRELRGSFAVHGVSHADRRVRHAEHARQLQMYMLPTVTPEQARNAHRQLVRLVAQVPLGWWLLPVLVGEAYERTRPGFLCVPYDLTAASFQRYLDEHLSDIRRERQQCTRPSD